MQANNMKADFLFALTQIIKQQNYNFYQHQSQRWSTSAKLCVHLIASQEHLRLDVLITYFPSIHYVAHT
jgi:hypothetical protein